MIQVIKIANIIFKILTCLQRWRLLLKAGDRGRLDDLMRKVRVWVQTFVESRGDEDACFYSYSRLVFQLLLVSYLAFWVGLAGLGRLVSFFSGRRFGISSFRMWLVCLSVLLCKLVSPALVTCLLVRTLLALDRSRVHATIEHKIVHDFFFFWNNLGKE